MLLAFLHWLSDGEPRLLVPVGSGTAFSLCLPPVSVDAPVSIVFDDDTEDEPDTEDELVPEDDDIVDFGELDDSDEPTDPDDHDDRQDDGTPQENDHEE